MELVSIILISIGFIIIFNLCKNQSSNDKNFEEKIYSSVGFEPYKAYKVEFNKKIKKPNGIYFQYNNGCVLYSLINIGYLDEKHIPSSIKYYKNHNYSQDEKTYEATLRRILSLIDLAQLWINLGGVVPYKENGKEVPLETIKKKIFEIIKLSIDKKEQKLEDIQSALKIAGQHERFMTVIGNIPLKPIYLKDCDFSEKLDKLNLKSAIDKGFIKENDSVFCLNHFIAYNGTIINNSKKYYVFLDSLTNAYRVKKWESMEGCKIFYDEGIIHAPEDSALMNIEETSEKTVGILKPLFI